MYYHLFNYNVNINIVNNFKIDILIEIKNVVNNIFDWNKTNCYLIMIIFQNLH